MEDKIKSIAIVLNSSDQIETVTFQSVASEINSINLTYSDDTILSKINNATVEWSSNE